MEHVKSPSWSLGSSAGHLKLASSASFCFFHIHEHWKLPCANQAVFRKNALQIVLVKIYNSKVADVCVAASVFLLCFFFCSETVPPSHECRVFWILGGESSSPRAWGHLCIHWVRQPHIERVVVLDQWGLVVVQHQVFQSAVQVVGLGETIATGRAVDDTVLHLAVHTTDRNMTDLIINVIPNQNLTSDKDKGNPFAQWQPKLILL